MSNQNRTPKGAPASAGGQFASGSHDEAATLLTEKSAAAVYLENRRADIEEAHKLAVEKEDNLALAGALESYGDGSNVVTFTVTNDDGISAVFPDHPKDGYQDEIDSLDEVGPEGWRGYIRVEHDGEAYRSTLHDEETGDEIVKSWVSPRRSSYILKSELKNQREWRAALRDENEKTIIAQWAESITGGASEIEFTPNLSIDSEGNISGTITDDRGNTYTHENDGARAFAFLGVNVQKVAVAPLGDNGSYQITRTVVAPISGRVQELMDTVSDYSMSQWKKGVL